ncbi:MAG: stage V sporulation protein AE [Clostridia bacterium]|nr:stage V sporulation protein AE [Clostridia bacterium]
MEYFNAFWVGGLLCAIGQILIDKTKLTPARILVIYVCVGAVLTAIGLYDPIVKYAGTGATIPISGFGYSLAKGVMEAVDKEGFIGIFTGGITATAAGIAAAVTFGLIFAILGKPKEK